MKLTGLIIVAAFLTSSAARASSVADYSADVGVQVIARAVVRDKLVDQYASKVILLALETGTAGFGKMECDRATGKDLCSFEVFVKDDPSTGEAEETLYRLDVNIYQGTVTSATWELLAG